MYENYVHTSKVSSLSTWIPFQEKKIKWLWCQSQELFLFIPFYSPFRFGCPALFNELMQFNCSSFNFQASLPKVLFPNVHSNRVTATCSGERYLEYIEQITSEKIYYSYSAVASVHVFKESQVNIFLLVE